MRILLASPGMGRAGAERVVVSLAEGLSARGHQVAVSGAPGPLDAELGANVVRLTLPERGRTRAGVLEWVLREAAFIRRFRPHVVHAHNPKATVAAAAAARLGRGPRRPPVLATYHSAMAPDRAGAARLLVRAADRIVCCSSDLLPTFEPFGVRPHVIHNGISLPAPGPAPVQALAADGRPLVLFVGRLEPQKNPHRFLDVAALVPEARFAMAGDGWMRAEVEARGTEVVILGARDDARALMARADLVLVSSDSEGQSIAVLEALAAGTPVVTTPVAGMRGLDGVDVADFTPEGLADAVRRLLRDPARRSALGAAGAKLVRERLSADVMVSAYEHHYRALLAPTIT
jgi:glycosyltransferase involved in cell wall biosynthesis